MPASAVRISRPTASITTSFRFLAAAAASRSPRISIRREVLMVMSDGQAVYAEAVAMMTASAEIALEEGEVSRRRRRPISSRIRPMHG